MQESSYGGSAQADGAAEQAKHRCQNREPLLLWRTQEARHRLTARRRKAGRNAGHVVRGDEDGASKENEADDIDKADVPAWRGTTSLRRGGLCVYRCQLHRAAIRHAQAAQRAPRVSAQRHGDAVAQSERELEGSSDGVRRTELNEVRERRLGRVAAERERLLAWSHNVDHVFTPPLWWRRWQATACWCCCAAGAPSGKGTLRQAAGSQGETERRSLHSSAFTLQHA